MTIEAAGLDLLFREARTHNKWQDRPISDETLRELYELMKFGPTSANSSPARFVFSSLLCLLPSGLLPRASPCRFGGKT